MFDVSYRDVLHPGRANCSKEELREKLAQLYKANKDQVNVFGLRTQYGGGKTTGFALIYDSHEAMKKFEPHYRLVRAGAAQKIEKPSRQQSMYLRSVHRFHPYTQHSRRKNCIDNLSWSIQMLIYFFVGKQRKNRAKTVRGVAKTKKKDKK